MKAVMALLQRDIRGIYRDGFLIMMAFYSLMLALVTRIAVQWVPLDHADLYIAPFIVITACSLVGMVFGFGLIEERETQTWLLMRVIPVSGTLLTGYWIVTVSGFSFVISLVSVAIYGLIPSRPGSLVLLTAVTSLGAPLVMLLLGAIASNKIEGLAVTKIISSSSLILIGALLWPGDWQLLLIWYPWYWLYFGLLQAYAGPQVAAALPVQWLPVPGWLYVVVPTLVSMIGIMLLVRRYRRVS